MFLAAGLVGGCAIAGPRRLLRTRQVWAGAALAVVLWSPWLSWQAAHHWPQLQVSRSIAAGGSTSSQPWWAIVPFQVLLVSPPLAPVWIAGLVRLFRDPATRQLRFLAWAWVVLAGVFMATGGKPYYLAGLLPVLIGAGSVQIDTWMRSGREGVRRKVSAAVLAASAVTSVVIALPVLPAADAGPVLAVNGDVAETIGWPELAHTVADVYRGLPDARRAVVLAGNYGEAGAIDRYGPGLGLPHAYSGHNAYGDWGPPPDTGRPVIVVGVRPDLVSAYLRGCVTAAHVANDANVENEEQGRSVLVCDGPQSSWSQIWSALRHVG